MRIRMYDERCRDKWEALVQGSSDATSGHLWQWREIIGAAYEFDSFYLVAEEPTGEPCAALPFIRIRSRLFGTELTSMPYIDYGGVCHRDSLPRDAWDDCDKTLFSYALQLGKGIRAKRLQVRNLRPVDLRFEVSTEKATQHLALASSSDQQMRRLPAERRNRLRRCEKLGLSKEILPVSDRRAFREFCDIYSTNMRDLGTPTHSVEFFRQVTAHFHDRASLIVIRLQGRAIASAIAFEFRGTLSLPWSGATLAARRAYGTNALYWAAVCLAIERGCHTFDFGRSSVSSGIFEFKRQWGPERHQAYWSTYYMRPGAKSPRERKELQLATRLWQHVPLAVTRAVGPSLRKGISN